MKFIFKVRFLLLLSFVVNVVEADIDWEDRKELLEFQFYFSHEAYDYSSMPLTEDQCQSFETCMNEDSIQKFLYTRAHKIEMDCASKFHPKACDRRNLYSKIWKDKQEAADVSKLMTIIAFVCEVVLCSSTNVQKAL